MTPPPAAVDIHAHYEQCLVSVVHLSPSEASNFCPERDAARHQQYLLLPTDLDVARILPERTRADLGAAAYALYRMAVAVDALIDEGRAGALRFAMLNAELAALLISRHLPSDDGYWALHRNAYDAMWNAAAIEARADSASLSELDAIRVAKSRLLELPVHWHSRLAPLADAFPLAHAILDVGKTFQAMDDISDFLPDLRAGKTSYAIRVVADYCASAGIDLRAQPHELQLRLLILTPAIREDLLALRAATVEAARTIEAHGMRLWAAVAARGVTQMDRYLDAIAVAHAPLRRSAA